MVTDFQVPKVVSRNKIVNITWTYIPEEGTEYNLYINVRGRDNNYSKTISNGAISQKKQLFAWQVSTPAGTYYLEFEYGTNVPQSDDFTIVEKPGTAPPPGSPGEPTPDVPGANPVTGGAGAGSADSGTKSSSSTVGSTIGSITGVIFFAAAAWGVYVKWIRKDRSTAVEEESYSGKAAAPAPTPVNINFGPVHSNNSTNNNNNSTNTDNSLRYMA